MRGNNNEGGSEMEMKLNQKVEWRESEEESTSSFHPQSSGNLKHLSNKKTHVAEINHSNFALSISPTLSLILADSTEWMHWSKCSEILLIEFSIGKIPDEQLFD